MPSFAWRTTIDEDLKKNMLEFIYLIFKNY